MPVETRCERCRGPRNRTATNARFCVDCAAVTYREGIRKRKRNGGSREQWETVIALWRDGTLRRVLEAVQDEHG
jgi:hypothetical protein